MPAPAAVLLVLGDVWPHGGTSTAWCLHEAGAPSFFTSAPRQPLHSCGFRATVLHPLERQQLTLVPLLSSWLPSVTPFVPLSTPGPSLEGGLLELRELSPNRASNSAMLASAALSCASNSAIRASWGSTSARRLVRHASRYPVQHHVSGHFVPSSSSTNPDP